ncbi:MAG: VOC family protein [Desulfurellaceae bacterium]|nr:VOC family protein [Desulfurellaceae bacterium]
MPSVPFHLALPVRDLEAARAFYVDLLGCSVGRESATWIDFSFFGHQVTTHLSPEEPQPAATNPVDGQQVPVRHFGVILDWDAWQALAERLTQTGVSFLIEPYIRFRGQVGEQATMFLLDPSQNGLEFKAFRDQGQIFAR